MISVKTLTVTDIRVAWTETAAVKNKAQKWVFAALMDITEAFPFPIIGIDSDNGSEFINGHLLRYCTEQKITFTRSRAGRKNDGAHVEQKNWSVVRRAVGYHRYDTEVELALLNQIQRVLADPGISKKVKTALTREYESLNPAQIRCDLLDLQDQLLDLVKAKYQPTKLPVKPPSPTRAPTREATKTPSRAS